MLDTKGSTQKARRKMYWQFKNLAIKVCPLEASKINDILLFVPNVHLRNHEKEHQCDAEVCTSECTCSFMPGFEHITLSFRGTGDACVPQPHSDYVGT
jgi:hypothetical protein